MGASPTPEDEDSAEGNTEGGIDAKGNVKGGIDAKGYTGGRFDDEGNRRGRGKSIARGNMGFGGKSAPSGNNGGQANSRGWDGIEGNLECCQGQEHCWGQ